MGAKYYSVAGNPRKSIARSLAFGALFLFVAAALLFYVLARKYTGSAGYLNGLETASGEHEKAGREALLARLGKMNALDWQKVISAGLSSGVIDETIQQFAGQRMTFTNDSLGEVAIQLDKLQTEFRDGFPRLACDGTVTVKGKNVGVKTVAFLEPELKGDTVMLRVRCLGLAPVGHGLPQWAGMIAKASATKAVNDELEKHFVTVPIGRQIKVDTGAAKPFTQWINTANGRVQINIVFPSFQVARSMHPREVFFTRDGMHIIADLEGGAPAASAVSAPPITPAANNAGAAFDHWRLAPGEDFRFTIGREIGLGLLREITTWRDAARTVTVRGVKEEGHLIDKTGGAPFGNGFGAWLDGPDRLQGSAVLLDVTADWQPQTQSVILSSHIAVRGSVQVHVHGNAPHIAAPRIFGHPIGGGVTVGGGAGTSIGARIDPDPAAYGLKAALTLKPDQAGFDVRLMEPEDLKIKMRIGGVPEELQHLFGIDGFHVKVPRDVPIFAFPVPSVILETVRIPLPQKNEKMLGLKVMHVKAGMDSEGFTISGNIKLSTDHAESAVR